MNVPSDLYLTLQHGSDPNELVAAGVVTVILPRCNFFSS